MTAAAWCQRTSSNPSGSVARTSAQHLVQERRRIEHRQRPQRHLGFCRCQASNGSDADDGSVSSGLSKLRYNKDFPTTHHNPESPEHLGVTELPEHLRGDRGTGVAPRVSSTACSQGSHPLNVTLTGGPGSTMASCETLAAQVARGWKVGKAGQSNPTLPTDTWCAHANQHTAMLHASMPHFGSRMHSVGLPVTCIILQTCAWVMTGC